MDISRFQDTIAAPATIPGTGAITVIRVSGPRAFEIADQVVKLRSRSVSDTPGQCIRYGTIFSEDGSVLDDVLVSVFRAPHSYTGEDSVEISCHASPYVASEILSLLCDAGARIATAGEFTRRAFVGGKMDLAQAEAVADVISANSSASLRVAQNQLRGGFSAELSSLRARLLEMTSLLELELDFSEEDVEFADRARLSGLLDEVLSKVDSLAASFRYGNALRCGVPVAIVGAVNAGKSTLLNALLGDDRAIVSHIAGTTRDTIEETTVIDGVLFRFVDTAGLRDTADEVERIGISRSYRKLSEASVVLAVLDLTATEEANESSISDILSKIDLSSQKLIVLFNKADVPGSTGGLGGIAGMGSIVHGDSLDNLHRGDDMAMMRETGGIAGGKVHDVVQAGDIGHFRDMRDRVQIGNVGEVDDEAKKREIHDLNQMGGLGDREGKVYDVVQTGGMGHFRDMRDRVQIGNVGEVDDEAKKGDTHDPNQMGGLDSIRGNVHDPGMSQNCHAGSTGEISDAIQMGNITNNINVTIINNSVLQTEYKFIKLYISAKSGFGIDELKKHLAMTQKGLAYDSDQTIVTNSRHYNALNEASLALKNVQHGITLERSSELLAEDLRTALHSIGTITGDITNDEVLGNIFERFCIGK